MMVCSLTGHTTETTPVISNRTRYSVPSLIRISLFSIRPPKFQGETVFLRNFPLYTRIFFHSRPLGFCQKGWGVILIKSILISEGILYSVLRWRGLSRIQIAILNSNNVPGKIGDAIAVE